MSTTTQQTLDTSYAWLAQPDMSIIASYTEENLTIKEAVAIAGTRSNPSKMPGSGTSTPASKCITGGKLQDVKGSVCEGCYAMKNAYLFSNVQPALEKRYDAVLESRDNPGPWINAMVALTKRQTYFRWHDSGDLQGSWHLANICEVARRTPSVKHWIPTREYRMVKDYLAAGGLIPSNLVVRLSAHMVDGPAPRIPVSDRQWSAHPWSDGYLPTSTVVTSDDATCPARFQANNCGTCRACWNPKVANVSYHKH